MTHRNHNQSLKCVVCLLILLFLADVYAFSVHQKRDIASEISSPLTLLHLLSVDRDRDDPEEYDPTELSQSSHDQFALSDYDPRRRHLLLQSTLVSILLQCFPSMPTSAQEDDMIHKTNSLTYDRGIFDDRTFLGSLTYDKILGRGSFKTVYKVRSNETALAISNLVADVDSQRKNTGSSTPQTSLQFAMSVEPLRTKSQIKEALRAIQIVQYLQQKMKEEEKEDGCQVDNDNFEQLYTWWIQKSNLSEFSPGRRIFSQSDLDLDRTNARRRTQKRPRNYFGTLWLVCFKPLYDIDLKTFIHNTPTMIPVGSLEKKQQQSVAARNNNLYPFGGLPLSLTEQSAIQFAFELCRAGDIVHSARLVHRDIKPKNIMIWKDGRPVIIDFGFAQFGDSIITSTTTTTKKRINRDNIVQKRICVTEPGKVKGEVGYVLAKDVSSYRGCQEGDLYAMGKTLFELYFEQNVASSVSSSSSSSSASFSSSSSSEASSSSSSPSSSQADVASTKHTINEAAARERNEMFRAKLNDPHSGTSSRFELSENGRDVLMKVIRGLCTEDNPLTFRKSARILQDFSSGTMNKSG
eukprot:CAMPEP_0113490926 /NCGR_PEP_ID=MMETSP0014_2-20120614/27295_1 /TAXON_ID=2857 /ORGANISM="Nitzschia sp." /LENGTH=578 /DNA_ID=CAMNT_0000384707 /DNA_START=17 /DNA_END=1753 /DNA_ORIENTATION=+ /assembly_acc=CAM_ASM_000159